MINYVIDKEVLASNVGIIRQLAGTTPVIAVLKCDGYGMGLIPYARFLSYRGIEIFGVSALEEATELKKAGISGEVILLTSNAVAEDAEEIVKNNVIATVGSLDAAKALDTAGKKLEIRPRAHLEINTGMGRCGFDAENILWVNELKKLDIDFSGTFTHYSFSFSANENDVKVQTDKFRAAVKKLNASGFETGMLHAANSHAFLKHPKTHFDAVRVGSAFLGRVSGAKSFGLKPVGYIESRVVDVNYLKKGENIGYGNTYKAKKDIKTAIIPVGYFHGYMAEKSNDTFRLRDIIRYILGDLNPKKQYVKIGNEKYKVIGRVATMNIIADITGSDVKPGDTVILPGNPIMIDSGIPKVYKGKDL